MASKQSQRVRQPIDGRSSSKNIGYGDRKEIVGRIGVGLPGSGGGGGLSDAPSDGTTYGRKDAVWVSVPNTADLERHYRFVAG